MNLTRVLRVKGYRGLIVTQAIASHLPDYQSVPVDCVLKEIHKTPYAICEIRQPVKGGSISKLSNTAKRFREAFHFMTKGEFAKALRIYRKIDAKDKTAERLTSRCLHHTQRGSTNVIMTVFTFPPGTSSSASSPTRTSPRFCGCRSGT